LAVKQKWWSLGCASQRAILDAAGGDRNLLDTLVASFYKSLGIEKRKYRSQEIEPLPPPKPPSGDPVSGTPAALELLRTRLAASGATDNRAFMLKVWQLSHGKRSSCFSLSLYISRLALLTYMRHWKAVSSWAVKSLGVGVRWSR
jgi:hypothetical protein